LKRYRFPPFRIFILSAVLCLFCTATAAYCREPLDSDLAKALKKVVKCEKIEVKNTGGDSKSGKLQSLLLRFVTMSKQVVPADYVTVQYTNPDINLTALKKSNSFKVNSSSNFKIGLLVSEQTVRDEFAKAARRSNLHFDKFLIKFTPPYIEVEFDIPVSAIPLKDRKLVEKFIRNKRLTGYAALRLEMRNNKVIASPVKVILNHFLLPLPLVAELKKRLNPVYQVQRIRPFDYNLVKIDIMKQHIFLSN
jgi:hypothetical protein